MHVQGGGGAGKQFSWDMFRSKEGVLSVGACSMVTVGTCALVKGRRVLFQLEHVQWSQLVHVHWLKGEGYSFSWSMFSGEGKQGTLLVPSVGACSVVKGSRVRF
jgi:hypothetical protein